MHELSITQSVVDAIVEKMGDAPIRRVRLEVGRLSGIVPEAMAFCFDLITSGTALDGAELEFDRPPGRGRCRTCGQPFDTDEVLPLCPCGSADVAVTGGTELRIREVEVLRTCAPPADAPTTPGYG